MRASSGDAVMAASRRAAELYRVPALRHARQRLTRSVKRRRVVLGAWWKRARHQVRRRTSKWVRQAGAQAHWRTLTARRG